MPWWAKSCKGDSGDGIICHMTGPKKTFSEKGKGWLPMHPCKGEIRSDILIQLLLGEQTQEKSGRRKKRKGPIKTNR